MLHGPVDEEEALGPPIGADVDMKNGATSEDTPLPATGFPPGSHPGSSSDPLFCQGRAKQSRTIAVGWWWKDGWVGSPPYFIYTHHAELLFFCDFVFAVRDDLARLLCPSPPGVGSGRAALHGCRAGLLDLPAPNPIGRVSP